MKNAWLVYKNQLKRFDSYILKNKQLPRSKTPTIRKSTVELFKPKPGSSAPMSIRFQSQKAIAERKTLSKQKTETGIKIVTPNKLLAQLKYYQHK